MKKYLWIGSFVSGEALTESRSRGYGNPASVQSQTNLIEGLERAYRVAFDTVGALVLQPYPQIKIRHFDEINFSHTFGASDCIVGFNNINYFSKMSSTKSLCEKTREWANLHKKDDVEVFIYEMRSACLRSAKILKKIIPSAKIYLIVPDLPAFMDLRMNWLKKVLKKWDWRSIQSLLDIVDSYILYAETMVDYLGIRNKRWMVMEGSINVSDIRDALEIKQKSDNFIVMYSGHIEERFGIKNLIDAFKYLPCNYELWITGRGNMAIVLEEAAKRDNRIKYYGFLPSRDDLLQLQSEADLFINMRDPNEPASHYCFPSKLFEYMLTGKPVLTCKLKGIPEEYYNYLYSIDGISPKEIAVAINKVSKITQFQRNNIGKAAREFIIKEKNNNTQCKRIKHYLEYNRS